MAAVRTFVILYTGREGSTPLIDLLGRHPSVCIPAFEHLDRQNLVHHVDNPAKRIGEILDEVLRTGAVPGREPNYLGEPVIGFKWRPFGGRRAVEALRRNHCLVVFLHRRDALSRALSMRHNPPHLQFTIARMTPAERTEALAQARAQRFRANPYAVAWNIVMYRRLKARQWRTYCGKGLEPQVLAYERLANQPLAAINGLLSTVGVEPLAELPLSRFARTSNDIGSQCDNFREIQSNRAVRMAVASHERLLRRIEGGEHRSRWSGD